MIEPFDCRYFAISPVIIGAEAFAAAHRTLRWRRVVARWVWKRPLLFNGHAMVCDKRVPTSEGFGFADDPRYSIDY